jgi:hypothetical protein
MLLMPVVAFALLGLTIGVIRTSARAVAAPNLAAAPAAANAAPGLPAISGLVLGALDGPTTRTYLADFPVYLKQGATVFTGTQARTDEYARFVFDALPAGGDVASYAVCWANPGWTDGCQPATAAPLQIVVTPTTGTRMIWGRVSFHNQTSPWFESKRFGIRQTVSVLLLPSMSDVEAMHTSCEALQAMARETLTTTTWGDYLVVDPPESGRVSARYGRECSEPQPYGPLSQNATYAPIESANSSPELRSLKATLVNGNPNPLGGLQNRVIRGASMPSEPVTIEVTITISDLVKVNGAITGFDEKTFCWATELDTLPVSCTASAPATFEWPLPVEPEVYRIYVLSADGKGGYLEESALVANRIGTTPTVFVEPPNKGSFLARSPGVERTDVPSERSALEDEARDYYRLVDPEHRRQTLGQWWAVNGFDPETGAGGVRIGYMNFTELGFGRDMNCLQRDADVACYVSNYGNPDQQAASAHRAATPIPSKALATVAMEYSPVEGQDPQHRIVKFYVFRGAEPNGSRLLQAQFEAGRDRFVPYACLNCHGGRYQPTAQLSDGPFVGDLGASFLPFVRANLRFPCGQDGSEVCTTASVTEEQTLADLNRIVSDTAPSERIVALIDGLYNGWQRSDQDASWTPAGWTTPTEAVNLYHEVVAPSCRTCHLAVARGSRAFDSYELFLQRWPNRPPDDPGIEAVVLGNFLGKTKDMPHSRVTFINAWCREDQQGWTAAQRLSALLKRQPVMHRCN